MLKNQKTEYLAAQWVIREDRGLRSDEVTRLAAWLDESTANRVAYLRLKASWSKTTRLAALRQPSDRVLHGVWISRNTLLLAAAMLVVLITGSGGVYYYHVFHQSEHAIYATRSGERPTLNLSDGSTIQLDANTEVRTNISSTNRVVALERGEAYFEVVHDPVRPFVVIAGNHKVTDIGTKFSVRRDGDNVYVVVKEGRVRVEPTNESSQPVAPVDASGGNVVVAKADETLIAPRSTQDIANDLGWRHGVLVLNDKTLAEAAEEFNRYNDKKLVVLGAAKNIQIGGSFRADNIEVFATLVRNALGLKVIETEKEITISQ